jgi:hypothetical protein
MAAPPTIPEELLQLVRNRSNRREQSRFPYKLWRLLDWAKDDPARCALVGCGWTSDSEFYIEKPSLCRTIQVAQNTLNVNLHHLGFRQSRGHFGSKTYWTTEGFCRSSQPDDFERIRNSRCRPEALQKLDIRAVYLPILEPIQLWPMTQSDTSQFKREVVNEWHRLVGKKLVFGVSSTGFYSLLLADLDDLHGRQAPDRILMQQAFTVRQREVCDIFDFAVFLARFGPYRAVPVKLVNTREPSMKGVPIITRSLGQRRLSRVTFRRHSIIASGFSSCRPESTIATTSRGSTRSHSSLSMKMDARTSRGTRWSNRTSTS